MKQIATLLQPLRREPHIPWWFFWLLGAAGLITLIVVIQMRRKPESTGPLTTETSRPARSAQDTTAPVATVEVAPSEPAAAEEGSQAISPDDLTKIEGVGPKISKLLQDAGITTFPQLASSSAEQLRQILRDANVRVADPETWPEQASLAAAGKWDELSQFQDTLKRGRRQN